MQPQYMSFEVGKSERKPVGIRSKPITSKHPKIIPRQFRLYLLSGNLYNQCKNKNEIYKSEMIETRELNNYDLFNR